MARKTVEVELMRKKANKMLAQSGIGSSPEFRWGVILMIEDMLHATGNYNGFRYLDNFEVADGVLPGVRRGEDGDTLSYEERFENTDETRRYYF